MRRRTRQQTISGFMGQLPSHLHNYIIGTKDVASDGHCGFRAIADLLGYTEDSWGRVRGELFHELSSNHELYSVVFISPRMHRRMEWLL